MNKKIVFCGGGNMAEGIIRSLLRKEAAAAEDITVSEMLPERCAYLNQTYGIAAVTDAADAIKAADMVVIAVLPQHVPSVTSVLEKLISKDTIVMSIAAGVTIASLEEMLGADKKVIRIMPNTLGQSGNGHSAVCLNGNIREEDKAFALQVLEALGQTIVLPESKFGEFTAFSCSGPLWLYQMADALIDAGVYAGFSRKEAREMVIKNMLGVAMILDETGDDPRSRVSEMCSPGGVTIEGYKSLIEEGFASAIMTSVDKAVKKANSI